MNTMTLSTKQFLSEVLRHYHVHGRHGLPWRQTAGPYAVLVSEVMLQQTQVERVIPYFEKWMRLFPTPHKLAKASLTDVLRAWSGLGYNRRAKMLHECAREVVGKHGGKVPKDFAALKALPGVGPYTAGAIRAFAFDEPEVFIETNIRAALIHHFFPRSKKVDDKKLVPILVECLAIAGSSREWYSALMDYGAHLKAAHPNPSRRSKHHTRQSKFEGSLRQVRGAILRALLKGARSEKMLLQELRSPHAQSALRALVREKLVCKTQGRWHVK